MVLFPRRLIFKRQGVRVWVHLCICVCARFFLSWHALFIQPACTAWEPCYFPWALSMHKGRSSALFISSRCITFLVLCDLRLRLRGANAAGSALQHKSAWCLFLLCGYKYTLSLHGSSCVLLFKRTFRRISRRTTIANDWTWCRAIKKKKREKNTAVSNLLLPSGIPDTASAIAAKWLIITLESLLSVQSLHSREAQAAFVH